MLQPRDFASTCFANTRNGRRIGDIVEIPNKFVGLRHVDNLYFKFLDLQRKQQFTMIELWVNWRTKLENRYADDVPDRGCLCFGFKRRWSYCYWDIVHIAESPNCECILKHFSFLEKMADFTPLVDVRRQRCFEKKQQKLTNKVKLKTTFGPSNQMLSED